MQPSRFISRPHRAHAMIFAFALLLFFSPFAHAQLPVVLPDCKPELPPSNPNSCNIPKFFQLMNNVMEWLVIIVTPIAGVLIIWGGILIMTAGGAPGNIERGKSVIRGSVVGLVIAFGAWIIMRTILEALGVNSAFLRGLGF